MSRPLLFTLILVLLTLASTLTAGEIHLAVAQGDVARVQSLLEADRSLANQPDDASEYQDLPLHIAARHGHLEVAELLLNAGAEVDGGDSDQSTALDVAAVMRQPEMVALLLEAGADPNHHDNNNAYSLSFAVSAGDSLCIQQLIDAGVEAENITFVNGATMLHLVARGGQTWIAQPLLDDGADINARSGNGQTPVQYAAGGTQPEMIDWLVERGADIHTKDNSGTGPLLTACWRERPESVRRLLALGCDPDQADCHGWGPLCAAARRGNADIVSQLIAADCNVDRRWNQGWTALGYAARNGNEEIVTMLLEAGACPQKTEDDFGRTPLHMSAVKGFGDISTTLVTHGACCDTKDWNGDTPSTLAARHGQTGVVACLAAAQGKKVNTSKTCQKSAACAQGKGVACNSATLAAQPRPAQGEAVTWYLGHSGWAILTHDHVLIFDYWEHDRQADEPGLACGSICPEELEGRKVVVFASHDHGDHWWPGVLEWRSQVEDVTYVLGFQPENVEGYEFVEPLEHYRYGNVKVTTTRSTDAGVGFMVEADGVSIFHPGDHHNRSANLDGIYREDIDWLAAAGARPDLCFLPISGCGFGDLEPVHAGADYTLETLQPSVFCPMHGGDNSKRYFNFVAERQDRFPGVKMIPVTDRGDRVFVGGKVVSAR